MSETKEKKVKKILGTVIGIMLFGIVALGVTYAFLISSAANNTNEITTAELSLDYQEHKQMDGGLIPIEEGDLLNGLFSLYNEDAHRVIFHPSTMCKDANRNTVCYMYDFTVTNTGDIAQDIDIYLFEHEVAKHFANLKYYVIEDKTISEMQNDLQTIYDDYIGGGTIVNYANDIVLYGTELGFVKSTPRKTYSLTYNPNEVYPGKKLPELTKTLEPNESKTYTLVFYLNETGENQIEDLNAQFLADIHAIGSKAANYNSGEVTELYEVGDANITGGVKYCYLEAGNCDNFFVFYRNYVIAQMPDMELTFPSFLGYYYDNTGDYVSIPGLGEIKLQNITNESLQFDLTMIDGPLVNLTKTTDKLPVVYDNELGMYLNTIYYDSTLRGGHTDSSGYHKPYYMGMGVIKDGEIYSYVDVASDINKVVDSQESRSINANLTEYGGEYSSVKDYLLNYQDLIFNADGSISQSDYTYYFNNFGIE